MYRLGGLLGTADVEIMLINVLVTAGDWLDPEIDIIVEGSNIRLYA